jgi:penicillin-insensitive murein DD-endopeptidase
MLADASVHKVTKTRRNRVLTMAGRRREQGRFHDRNLPQIAAHSCHAMRSTVSVGEGVLMRLGEIFAQGVIAVLVAGSAVVALAGAQTGLGDGTPVGRWAAPALDGAGVAVGAPPAPAAAVVAPTAVVTPALPVVADKPIVADKPVEAAPASAPVIAALPPPRQSAPADGDAAAPPAAASVPDATTAAAEAANEGTPGLKPAKVLFGEVKTAAPLAARAIGNYSRGCLAGAKALPVDGPAWQAMRLSRNRNWGHPKLVSLVQRLAADGKAKDGWPGLLVGDLAQPRGGPMLTGHASHQIGLDADIWLTPMPDRRLSNQEREDLAATSMLSDDSLAVNRDRWTDSHLKIIKRAASYSEVERVLVHPAIKQVLCYGAGDDRSWLSKVRPYWGHHYHFHVRIGCPAGSSNCSSQAPVPGDDGCGKELEDWIKLLAKITPEPSPIPLPPTVPAKPAKEKAPITLDKLPSECRVVLATGNPLATKDIAAAAAVAVKPTGVKAAPGAKTELGSGGAATQKAVGKGNLTGPKPAAASGAAGDAVNPKPNPVTSAAEKTTVKP